jgi:homopolymeric O-antigen transport system ATP-binding protein
MDCAIRFENVSKSFSLEDPVQRYTTVKRWISELVTQRRDAVPKRHQALKDLSFEVPTGGTMGIIGRNGSGKSTIIRLVARIYRPDSGRITTRGRVAALLELGGGFHPDFTGRENVKLEGVMLGLSPAEVRARMDAVVQFADLGSYIDQPVRMYSTGMFTRLAFAVAIQVDPDILLLDEVLAVGDEGFVAKCRRALDEMQARGTTIVLVTHSLETVQRWCNSVLWLDQGTVRMLGEPREVVQAYHRAWGARPAREWT